MDNSDFRPLTLQEMPRRRRKKFNALIIILLAFGAVAITFGLLGVLG